MALWNMRTTRKNGEEQHEVEVPSEIEEQFKAAREAHEKLVALENAQAEKDTLIQKMTGELEELKARIPAPTREPPAQPQAPDPIADPDAYFNYRMAPVVNVMLQNTARNELDIFSRNTPDWRHFGAETTELVRKGSIQQQADPQFIQNCYLIIKGRHAEEIRQGKFGTENGVGNGSGTPTNEGQKKPEFTLSDEQVAFGKRYGLSDEALLKAGQGLKFVN